MENRSLRVSGHVSSMNRTFIVEDYAEDEFGQWAKDEVTGEQGYVDDERSCFWTWDDTECAWQSRPFKGRQVKRRKGKGKGVNTTPQMTRFRGAKRVHKMATGKSDDELRQHDNKLRMGTRSGKFRKVENLWLGDKAQRERQ